MMVGPAHPRSRGENSLTLIVASSSAGSSPLTRGKRSDVRRRIDHTRLIPAHAGKTSSLAGAPLAQAAHPRSRGENKEHHGELIAEQGSSPLTRGKRALDHFRERVQRLIPAHAGKTP